MLAGRLQRCTTTLAARMEDALRVRLHLSPATGSGTALCRKLRASSRRSHRPTGQIQPPGRTQDWIKLRGKVNTVDDVDGPGLIGAGFVEEHDILLELSKKFDSGAPTRAEEEVRSSDGQLVRELVEQLRLLIECADKLPQA